MRKEECCKEKEPIRCSVGKCIAWGVLGVVGFVAIAALLGLTIMLLWNWLVPGIFSLPAIGYSQAIGLAVLFRLLFGGCGGGFKHFHRKHHGRWHKSDYGCRCESEKECCSEKKNEAGECDQKEEDRKA